MRVRITLMKINVLPYTPGNQICFVILEDIFCKMAKWKLPNIGMEEF